MSEQKIVVQKMPEERLRYFFTSKLMAKSEQKFFRPIRKKSEPFLEMVGEPGSEVVRKIMKISGVISINTTIYSIGVKITPAHDWDDVQGRILKIIAEVVFDKKLYIDVNVEHIYL